MNVSSRVPHYRTLRAISGQTTKLTFPARTGELRTPRTDTAGRARCSVWFGVNPRLLMKNELPLTRPQCIDAATQDNFWRLCIVPACGRSVDQDSRVIRRGKHSLVGKLNLGPVMVQTVQFANGGNGSISRDHPSFPEQQESI